MLQRLFLAILICFFIFSSFTYAAKVNEYLPTDHKYNQEIPTPESSLGFEVGERHIRHDQLITYMKALASSSARTKLTNIGKTQELRQQFLLTVSSAENLANLDEILAKKSKDIQGLDSSSPLVIWLGYSVHGDEISGANAAMVVAYHLAASENVEIQHFQL